MPFNGSGSFSPYVPGNPAITGTVISSTAYNATQQDIAAGLSNVVTRDGQSPPFSNLPMAGQKLTGLGAGTTNGDSVRFEQLSAIPYLPAGTGAVATTVQAKLRDFVSVKDFGAVGDGAANDTTALSNAIAAAVLTNQTLYFPAGTYLVTSSLAVNAVGVKWTGDGTENTIIKASGNFAQILELQSGSADFFAYGITFDQTNTTTRCVKITRGQTPEFENCGFRGNFVGTLVHSTGDIVSIVACKFDMNSANTVGLEFDEFNQNCYVGANTRFGGIGKGLLVSRSGTNRRVEGLKVNGAFFINTGEYNISIGNSFLTLITCSVMDQANDIGIRVDGAADKVSVAACWIGLKVGSVGSCIDFQPGAGGGHSVIGNQLFGGNIGIGTSSTATLRVQRLIIADNQFSGHANQSLSLNSVFNCTITGNQDAGTPSAGSWITSATNAAGGSYTFDNNRWHSTAPALFHTGSTYLWGNDTGIVARASGESAVASGASNLVINHGLFRLPRRVLATPKYTTSIGSIFTNSYTATQFTATWPTATVDANCLIQWEAVV